jgi:hypothetical protein
MLTLNLNKIIIQTQSEIKLRNNLVIKNNLKQEVLKRLIRSPKRLNKLFNFATKIPV